MSTPNFPEIACSILRGVIGSLASAGVVTPADAEVAMRLLGLGDSFIDRDASREIDRLTVENERLRAGSGTK